MTTAALQLTPPAHVIDAADRFLRVAAVSEPKAWRDCLCVVRVIDGVSYLCAQPDCPVDRHGVLNRENLALKRASYLSVAYAGH
jgi:hypothetical protein